MEMNPYHPPVDETVDELSYADLSLATPGARLAASLLDGLFVGGVNLLITWQLGLFDEVLRRPKDIGLTATTAAIGFGIWLVLQIAFLRSGQTIGKRIVGLRMVDYETGVPPSVGWLIVLRYLPVQIMAVIPVIGPLLTIIDALFIFGSERRCIHDQIAGTKVVRA